MRCAFKIVLSVPVYTTFVERYKYRFPENISDLKDGRDRRIYFIDCLSPESSHISEAVPGPREARDSCNFGHSFPVELIVNLNCKLTEAD